jgi:DNA repair protein RadC
LENLSNKELLARLLKISKKRIRGESMYEIVNLLPDEESNLVKEICCRYGEKRVKQGESFTNSEAIYNHFKIRLGNQMQETFTCIYLDNKHRIMSEKEISIGIINKSLVHPREVFTSAISIRACAIILIHNHPSGDEKPSGADIEITKRLFEVGKLVGIEVLDHIIIGDSYYSFVDEGIMPESKDGR